ncbi:MAG: hypothetical protein FJY85_17840, partial [Deltaproteobacteria bacterium]|nr:hypothetical protein [Deltaproteobacteria bacterium]
MRTAATAMSPNGGVTAEIQTEQNQRTAGLPLSVTTRGDFLNRENDRRETSSDNRVTRIGRSMVWDFKSRGEPFVWGLGGALVIGLLMIIGFVILIMYNGLLTFYPRPLEKVTLKDGTVLAGELSRVEAYRPGPETLAPLSEEIRQHIEQNKGMALRYLYRTGNFDLYNEDFRWVPDYQISEITRPTDLYFFERTEWGPFIGTIKSAEFDGRRVPGESLSVDELRKEQEAAANRRTRIRDIERDKLAAVNYYLEKARLKLRKMELEHG